MTNTITKEQMAQLVDYLVEGNTIVDLATMYIESLNQEDVEGLLIEAADFGHQIEEMDKE